MELSSLGPIITLVAAFVAIIGWGIRLEMKVARHARVLSEEKILEFAKAQQKRDDRLDYTYRSLKEHKRESL